MGWHWGCLWPVPSEPSDPGLRLKSSRKESWPFPPHSSFFPRRLQEGNAWFSSSCSQRCTCRAGAIQCRPFACPAGSQCKTNEDGKEICKPHSKGALGRCSRGAPRLGRRGCRHRQRWALTAHQLPDRLQILSGIYLQGQKREAGKGAPLKLGEGEGGKIKFTGSRGLRRKGTGGTGAGG